jgi:uncharacterized protein YdaU (DUF1376 family)
MKDVPYFPLYAANIMSSRAYKLMSLPERGLWITIFMECWVNGGVPANFKEMAKILGFPEQEISQFFSNFLTAFFHIENGQYISRELEKYRQGYLATREKQRLAGIDSAEKKKETEREKEKEKQRLLSEAQSQLGRPQGIPTGQPKGSLNYINSNSISLNQLTRREVLTKEQKDWADGLSNTSDNANAYAIASRG